MKLQLFFERYSIARLPPDSETPSWAIASTFYFISKTADELSIVCEERLVPPETKCESGWRLLRIQGTLDFGLTGVLASIAAPLAKAQVSIFAISTFDTDYFLVRERDIEIARAALLEAGFQILSSSSNPGN